MPDPTTTPAPSADDKRRIRNACTRVLGGHEQRPPADELARMADWVREDGRGPDVYGKGELIDAFEARIAALLGKGAAVFMPSGTMAQQIALRIHADAAGTRNVGLHATSHLELHEHRGYAHLHGLAATTIGEAHRPIVAADVDACPERLAAVITELPIREAGGLLPTWDELGALKATCARRGIKLHMDGARLWESQAFYGRPHAEICDGFDSVYVSFYKGIGGLTGAALAGPKAFVAESRIWLRRHGGNLFQQHPFVVSAAMQFDQRLEQMPRLLERARHLAAALQRSGVALTSPVEPQTNLFHIFLRGAPDRLERAHLDLAERERFWLAGRFNATRLPGWSSFEVYVGDNAERLSDDEICAALRRLVDAAAAAQESER